jgi:hypothetical protein
MRVIYWLVLIVLVLALVGFVYANPTERVNVTLFQTPYEDVALYWVAFFAFAIGVAFTAVVALIEGATIRLANRRLRRRIQRLQAETSFVATDSRPAAVTAPDGVGARAPLPASRSERPYTPPASAPVYGPDTADEFSRED